MHYLQFTTKTEAEAAVAEKRSQGFRAYLTEYRSNRFEVRFWA